MWTSGSSGGRLNKVVELFQSNKPAFGVFPRGRSSFNAAELAQSRLDFVLVDMEHAPLDFERLHTFLLGMVSRREILEKGSLQPDVMPFVRVPQNGREQLQYIIKQVLDIGVYGIMVPHVNTAEQARAAVTAMRYPQRRGAEDKEPEGQRGFAPAIAAHYWGLPVEEYRSRADLYPLDKQGELVLVVQVEEAKAVRNIDRIVKVPGVGAAFIGPADLSVSLGVDTDAPEVEKAIQKILKACKEHGVPCGITAGAETVEKRVKQGFQFITTGGDVGITQGAGETLQKGLEAAERPTDDE